MKNPGFSTLGAGALLAILLVCAPASHAATADAQEEAPAVAHSSCAAGDELDFYRDVAAAQLDPWRQTGITGDHLERARALRHRVRYQIIGGRLYRSRDCLFPKRCEGIEHFLLEVAPELPDLEFVLNVNDYPLAPLPQRASGATGIGDPIPVFSFSKIPGRHADILYPAWAFWEGGPWLKVIPGWRWDLNRRELMAAGDEQPWDEKTNLVFFRGSRTNADREPLMFHSQDHPEQWDVRFTLNQSQKTTRYVTEVLKIEPAEPVSPRDHCRYRYLLNFDGIAASFRLRNILPCGATVLYANPTWVEFFYAKLEPWKHYVPLGLEAEEAQEVVDFLMEHEELPRRIAANGREFIDQHLTLGHVRRYWLRLLQEYAALQRFEPELDEDLTWVERE